MLRGWIERLDVTRILVPGKLHTLIRTFDHPLFVKQKNGLSQKRCRDLGHESAKEKIGKSFTRPITIADEVTLTSVRYAHNFNALGVHHGIGISNKVRAFFS